MVRPPHRVLPPDADLAAAAADAVRRGWLVHQGFVPPAEPWDLAPRRMVAVGAVGSAGAARAALLCAVRGTGLLVIVDRAQPWAAAFLADLSRLAAAPAGPRPEPGRAAVPDLPLSSEQREMLDLLAGGRSIAQAATDLFVSLRTANRRVAEAREALGVGTTREAVLAYVRARDAGR